MLIHPRLWQLELSNIFLPSFNPFSMQHYFGDGALVYTSLPSKRHNFFLCHWHSHVRAWFFGERLVFLMVAFNVSYPKKFFEERKTNKKNPHTIAPLILVFMEFTSSTYNMLTLFCRSIRLWPYQIFYSLLGFTTCLKK